MRQFILGGNVAYASSLESIAAGALAVSYLKDGVPTLSKKGNEDNFKSAELILGNANKVVGNVVIPLYANNFTYSKMAYEASTKYNGELTIGSVVDNTDYTVIIAKKGVPFNERNKWSFTVRSKTSTAATDLVKEFVKQINASTNIHGIKADVSSSTLQLNGVKNAEDFEVIVADGLFETEVTQVHATIGTGSAEIVKDMARKAAADAGIEYTYQDDVYYLYPNYPLNPLASPDASDTGFEIFTMRFNEPREVATMSDTVNTIVQVALPTGGAGNVAFETVLKGMTRVAEAQPLP